MNRRSYQSWGRYTKADQEVRKIHWRNDALPYDDAEVRTILPYGNGRSYGDVCLNDGGLLLDCRGLDRFIRLDPEIGLLCCESGVLLSDILKHSVPRGWFLPVVPGTKFVTVGGAIANDVHGKNHHQAGSFGCYVRCFELLRSDGGRLICSATENEVLFRATIGGMGLTGVITWAEIQLQRINGPVIRQEVIRYKNLSEFFSLARESDRNYAHTVAWVDCAAKGSRIGRGLFIRGNYAETREGKLPKAPRRGFNFPVDPPLSAVNGLTLKIFNKLYYRKQWSDRIEGLVHYEPFFFPLDTILNWNRAYGSKGFLQYQCALPTNNAEDAIQSILDRISRAGLGSSLSVLKVFGNKASPGLMSFPKPGATLALDFPNNGKKTLELIEQLDRITRESGGRIYAGKDVCMKPETFQTGYPQWKTMEEFIDPSFSSSFWRRVTSIS